MTNDYLNSLIHKANPGTKFVYNKKLLERTEMGPCSFCAFSNLCKSDLRTCCSSMELDIPAYYLLKNSGQIGYIDSLYEDDTDFGTCRTIFEYTGSPRNIPVNNLDRRINPKFILGEQVFMNGFPYQIYQITMIFPSKNLVYTVKSMTNSAILTEISEKELSKAEEYNIPNYKVGDIVKIRTDLLKDHRYGRYDVCGSMLTHRGKTAKIIEVTSAGDCVLNIDNGKHIWTYQMFEPITISASLPELKSEKEVKSTISSSKGIHFVFVPKPIKIVSHFKQFKINNL